MCPAAEAEPLPSSSSSNCRGGDPRAGGVDLQPQGQMQQGTAWAGTPPLPRTSAPSLKRATREGVGLDVPSCHGRARELSLTASSGGWRESRHPHHHSFPSCY